MNNMIKNKKSEVKASRLIVICIVLLFLSALGVRAVIIGGKEGGYYNGTIDEVRIWGRVLSPREALQNYYSNLYKYDTDKWGFYTNQSGLTSGIYTYYGCAKDIAGNINCTETRVLNVEGDIIPPTYSGFTNNDSGDTKVGGDVNWSITLQDEIELGNYRFAHNNSGTLTNRSPIPLSDTSAFVSALVPNIVGSICGQFWFEDAAGNVNQTGLSCFTVENTLPTHTTPVITSSDLLNRTNGTLYCWNQSTFDADGDLVINNYKWFNNSKWLSGETDDSLGYGNFSKGDTLTCEITPSDSSGNGIPLNASILIRNSRVNITKIEITDNGTSYSNMYLTPVSGSRAKAAIRAIISDRDGPSNQSVIAYLCNVSYHDICNEATYTYKQNLTYLEEAPGNYNYYYTYNGTEEMPQFWRESGMWKLYIRVLDEEFSDYNETDFEYVPLSAINYSGLVNLGGGTNINLGEWNNGTDKYTMMNFGNVNLSLMWNASDPTRQTGGGLWTLNGTDFAVDDDNDYAVDTNIPMVFLNATEKIFEPASGLLTCSADECININATLDTYYHIAPRLGLPEGTYNTDITITVRKK